MATLIVAEPPSAYARRPRLVVDASVVAAAVFAEPEIGEAFAWMHGRALCAPSLLGYELASVAAIKVGRNAVEASAARAALEALAALDLEQHEVEAAQVFELEVRYRLTAYDAAYLWLAAELGAPIATFDAQLGAAARRHLAG